MPEEFGNHLSPPRVLSSSEADALLAVAAHPEQRQHAEVTDELVASLDVVGSMCKKPSKRLATEFGSLYRQIATPFVVAM